MHISIKKFFENIVSKWAEFKFKMIDMRGHPLRTYAKFSEKLTFVNIVFLESFLIDDP